MLIKVRGFKSGQRKGGGGEREITRPNSRTHDKFILRHVRLHPWLEGDDITKMSVVSRIIRDWLKTKPSSHSVHF